MKVQPFSAQDLFTWLTTRENFLLLDVRNDVEFKRFKVEGPYPFEVINVPYMDFIEHEEESVERSREVKNCALGAPRKDHQNSWAKF